MRSLARLLVVAVSLVAAACSGGPADTETDPPATESSAPVDEPAVDPAVGTEIADDGIVEEVDVTDADQAKAGTEVATFGAGCFWCVEAVLEQMDGVTAVSSGYMGGETLNPTYRDVCSGTTGHAEVVQVTFDPAVISYAQLLDWFWQLHDPTTLNRQGADAGTQYRSAIYFHSEAQRAAAEASKKSAQSGFDDPIVTEITKASTYYVAEDSHQDYYRLNKEQGYCRAVIAPKLKKLDLED